MPESVREFFEDLPAKVDRSKTAGMNASYLFDVEGAGTWTVSVDEGVVDVQEGGEDADVTISASEKNFLRILRGEQNPMTAYMMGKLKVSGDISLAMKLQKLF